MTREEKIKEVEGWEIDECIYNPMTGQFGRYEYARFEGSAEVLENGKIKYTVLRTIWSGDAEDNGDELNCDKGETTVHAECVVDTVEEMEEWCHNGDWELVYEGNYDQTYAGGVDHDTDDY